MKRKILAFIGFMMLFLEGVRAQRFYDNDWHMFGWGIFGFLGFIIMLLFWAAVIYLIYLAIKSLTKSEESALEILEKRYARGEITKKTFEEMKRNLRR